MICIYDQNFLNWDIYITNYLTLFKMFRVTLNKIFSKNEINIAISKLKIIYLDVTGVTNYFTDKDKFFSFAMTQNEKNQLITFLYMNLLKFRPHFLNIILLEEKFEYSEKKEQRVCLNNKQMRVVEKLAEFWNMEDFFQKKLTFNSFTGDISLDLSYLTNFDDMLLKFIKKTENLNLKECVTKAAVFLTYEN